MSTLNLELPSTLHDELESIAQEQGVSVDQLALLAVAEKLAVLRWQEGAERRRQHDYGLEQLQSRANRGSRERFVEVLESAGHNAPQPDDEIL